MRAALVATCLWSAALVVPAEETGPRHLIYLHGRIVQEQQDPLEQILATFRERGFVVADGIRPKGESVSASADRVVGQVRSLIASGVPASRITVVGGSMGGSIALLASLRLQDPAVGYCVLGVCLSRSVPQLLAEHGAKPRGRILAIHEKSDETSEPCPAWSGDTDPRAPLVVREILLDTGLRHGFLYRPLREWVEPALEWATQR
jgi:pimeloyl-ACP methyl ester carboxylesterase